MREVQTIFKNLFIPVLGSSLSILNAFEAVGNVIVTILTALVAVMTLEKLVRERKKRKENTK